MELAEKARAQDHKWEDQIRELNLKVLAREKGLKTIAKILHTLKWAAMARYDENSKHWNYLKIRGPTFLVSDKFGQLKLAIMNQLAIECSVVAIQPDNRLELRTLEDGWILNYAIQDSIMSRSVYGLWSQDAAICDIHKTLLTVTKC